MLRHELQTAVLRRRDRRRGQRLHPHEPLRRDQRLDDRVAALAVADRVHVRLSAYQAAVLLAVARRRAERASAIVMPREWTGVGVHRAVGVHDVDRGQTVALADLEVVRVVGGRHFHRAGAERRVDRLVGDDRDEAVDDGQASHACPTRWR